ncbi:MAG: cysteine hydrolase [Chloroflexi bacterium]|nr:cysteine hydrolase [Chloroflexota bacterium]
MLVVKGKQVLTTLADLVNPRHAALVLVDVQNDFVMPGGFVHRHGFDVSPLVQVVPRIKAVLDAARRAGGFVVHIQTTFYPDLVAESPAALHARLVRMGLKGIDVESPEKVLADCYCMKDTWGWKFVDELTPLPDEVVVQKHHGSAFIGTDLDLILRSNERKSLVIVGVVTQGCVMTTTDDAAFFEYCPVLLSDCVASQRPQLHEAALLIMSYTKYVTESSEVLRLWAKSRER